MKIGIVGCGVVGNATASVFKPYHEIFIYDKYKEGHLNLYDVVYNSEVIFISVPTPFYLSGRMDTSALEETFKSISEKIKTDDKILCVKSTAVPDYLDLLKEKYAKEHLYVAYSPEFLTEKNPVEDFRKSDRIIIGTDNHDVFKKIREVHIEADFTCPILQVDIKTASMIKYTSNAFLSTKVTFANEIYHICQRLGINYEKVIEVLLMDKRIGNSHFGVPGHDGDLGFGGKCFPKDLSSLAYMSNEHGHHPDFLREVWRSNLKWRKKIDWSDQIKNGE